MWEARNLVWLSKLRSETARLVVRLHSVAVSHRLSGSREYISASDSSDAALNDYALLILSGDMAVESLRLQSGVRSML